MKIVGLLFTLFSLAFAIKLQMINPLRVDIIVTDVYPRVTLIRQCNISKCINITNYTVDVNVIKFEYPFAGNNLTVFTDIYNADGTFANSTSITIFFDITNNVDSKTTDEMPRYSLLVAVVVGGIASCLIIFVAVFIDREKKQALSSYIFSL